MIRPPGRRTRRTIEGSIAWMRMRKACRKQGGRRRDQGTRCARLLTQVGTCKEGRKFANVSTGADTKLEPVRSPGGLLQRAQRRVTLEALCESSSSFRTEMVPIETARTGTEVEAEWCQRVLTRKRTLWGGGALERCHGAFLEPFTQLGDALCSVGATAETIEAAELVEGQAAKGRRCQWALTRKRTLGRQRTSAP